MDRLLEDASDCTLQYGIPSTALEFRGDRGPRLRPGGPAVDAWGEPTGIIQAAGLVKMRPSAISALVNNGEPQTLQNWRVTARPLLAVTVNSPGSPWSKRNAACEIPNTVANALPVAF